MIILIFWQINRQNYQIKISLQRQVRKFNQNYMRQTLFDLLCKSRRSRFQIMTTFIKVALGFLVFLHNYEGLSIHPRSTDIHKSRPAENSISRNRTRRFLAFPILIVSLMVYRARNRT